MLSVIMLNISYNPFTLSMIMLSDVMLSVVAPILKFQQKIIKRC